MTRKLVIPPPHSWAKSQKPAKYKIEIFVKLTDHVCACNNLTIFWYKANKTRDRDNVNLYLEHAWKNSWNWFKWIYFWRFLAIWNHCAPSPPPREAWVPWADAYYLLTWFLEIVIALLRHNMNYLISPTCTN